MKNLFFSVISIAAIVLTLGLYGCKKDKEDPTLDVSPAGTLSFVSAGETKTLTVTSNTDWNVSASEGWLTVSPASGKGNAKVSVTAAASTTTQMRTATLSFTATDVPKTTVSVSQEAAPITIAVTATGLDNLRVNQEVSGSIVYTLADGTYATNITAADFNVTGLPPGLTGTAVRTGDKVVTLDITGKPTTYKETASEITLPTSIPAANITGAAVPVILTGTATASAVAKGAGAEVTTPTLKTVTATSIEMNPVTITNNPGSQAVEYSLSTSSSNPSTLWQTDPTFNTLNASTQYYIWARSKSDDNYDSGAAKCSAAITTSATTTTNIAVTTTGLNNLKVNQNVNATIVYTLTGNTYAATITSANFAISGLPPGLTAAAAQRTSGTVVTVQITGTPTTYKTTTTNITLPTSIPAANITGATNPVTTTGTATASEVAKGDGAEVNVPTVKTVTSNTIEMNPATIEKNPGNQVVEYSLSESSSSPTTLWQTSPDFYTLKPSVKYYIWARSKANTNYNAGAARVSAAIATAPPKTVTVSLASSPLTAGTGGSVTYTVTTANIANGSYSATVTNLPAGVSVGNIGAVVINNNSGMLTLVGTSSITAGITTNHTLTIDNTTSGNFTITINVLEDGSALYPFLVYNEQQLAAIGADATSRTKHYKLMANISLTSKWAPIGNYSNNLFTGSFDGNSHTITFTAGVDDEMYAGLFGYIGSGGRVSNLTVAGNISTLRNDGSARIGGIAGENRGRIENCAMLGNVSISGSANSGAGGIAGSNSYGGTTTNCYATGAVSSTSSSQNFAGGIAGSNSNDGTIANCYATGAVSATGSGSSTYGVDNFAGGIVGFMNDFVNNSITNCVALNSSISATSSNPNSTNTAGRIVGGYDAGTLTNNYSYSSMTGGTTGTLNDKNGTGVSATPSVSWWQTASNWNTTPPNTAWNFTTIWQVTNGARPTFR